MSNSTISNIRFFPRDHNAKGVRATVYFTVGNLVEIKGAIMENAKGMFVSLPGNYYEGTNKQTQQKERKWDAQVRPLGEEQGKELQSTILTAFKNYTPKAPVPVSKGTNGATKHPGSEPASSW